MSRFLISHLSLAVAAVALSPMFAMADEGGGGGGALTLEEALKRLDPETATDWNKGGQPAVERLQALTGNQHLTRADVVKAAPDLDRERAPKIATPAAPAPAAPAPDDSTPPAWALALFDKIDKLEERNSILDERNEELNEKLAELQANPASITTAAAEALLQPPAAPTPVPRQDPAYGDSLGAMTPRQQSEQIRLQRRWPGNKGGPLKDVEMIAIAIGQYPAQPGKLRSVGERFMFSGIPGSWMVPAADPEVPLYLSGEKTQEDAAVKWGLRAEMSA